MHEEAHVNGVKMQKRQYVGKTLDEALDQASLELNTERENLSYNILPAERGGGLFKKLFQKSIRVEAWVERTQDLQEAARNAVREAIEGGDAGSARSRARKKAAPNNEVSSHSRPSDARPAQKEAQQRKRGQVRRPDRRSSVRGPADQETIAREENPNAITFDTEGVQELLERYTEKFVTIFDADLSAVTFAHTDTGDMRVSVQSENLEDLLSRSDRLAGSFEHVFKRIVQKKVGDLPQRLIFDAGHASENRIENLKEMARSMAEKVKTTGRSITVNSKSGQERRVIHLTIDEIEGVATRSIGSGDNRKLVIYSTEKGRRKRGARRSNPSQGRREPRAAAEAADGATPNNQEASFAGADPQEPAPPQTGSRSPGEKARSGRPRRNRRPRSRRPAGPAQSSNGDSSPDGNDFSPNLSAAGREE